MIVFKDVLREDRIWPDDDITGMALLGNRVSARERRYPLKDTGFCSPVSVTIHGTEQA